MKKTPKIILTLGMVFGFIGTGFAASGFATDSSQNVQHYRAMVSTDTVMNYSKTLLDRSSVARKLKESRNPSDQARYNEALEVFDEANKAFQAGESEEAKKLALESIRVIARSVPQYYSRLAREKHTFIARNEQ